MNPSQTPPAAHVIPVILVTGFLGSGKTTFLRHLMRRQAGRRFVYLVNDFSAVDVDAQLLREASGDVLSIPGGSIFCRCLVTEFIGALRRIADVFDTAAAPVEGVVIEASGMANPRVAGELLQDTGLAARFRLAGVICLVDPGSLHKLLHTLPAVRAQIEAADLALVNKADLHDAATLARTEQALREIQPGLAIQRCTRADVAVQPFTGTSQALRIHGELAGCRDPDYLSATVRFRPGQRCEAAAVLACLNAEADMLLRAKGFVPTREGFVALEWSVGNSALSPAPPGIRVGALAIITRGDESARLDRLVAALEGHR